MAIGTTAAILGSALIGSASSALAGHSASKAASEAATADNALQASIYNQNSANEAGFMPSGAMRLATRSTRLLGGGGGQSYAPQGYAPQQGVGSQAFDPYAAYVQSNPDLLAYFNAGQGLARGKDISTFGREHYGIIGQSEGRQLPTAPQASQNALQATQPLRPWRRPKPPS
jgi:hypothetical protein